MIYGSSDDDARNLRDFASGRGLLRTSPPATPSQKRLLPPNQGEFIDCQASPPHRRCPCEMSPCWKSPSEKLSVKDISPLGDFLAVDSIRQKLCMGSDPSPEHRLSWSYCPCGVVTTLLLTSPRYVCRLRLGSALGGLEIMYVDVFSVRFLSSGYSSVHDWSDDIILSSFIRDSIIDLRWQKLTN